MIANSIVLRSELDHEQERLNEIRKTFATGESNPTTKEAMEIQALIDEANKLINGFPHSADVEYISLGIKRIRSKISRLYSN